MIAHKASIRVPASCKIHRTARRRRRSLLLLLSARNGQGHLSSIRTKSNSEHSNLSLLRNHSKHTHNPQSRTTPLHQRLSNQFIIRNTRLHLSHLKPSSKEWQSRVRQPTKFHLSQRFRNSRSSTRWPPCRSLLAQTLLDIIRDTCSLHPCHQPHIPLKVKHNILMWCTHRCNSVTKLEHVLTRSHIIRLDRNVAV